MRKVKKIILKMSANTAVTETKTGNITVNLYISCQIVEVK